MYMYVTQLKLDSTISDVKLRYHAQSEYKV